MTVIEYINELDKYGNINKQKATEFLNHGSADFYQIHNTNTPLQKTIISTEIKIWRGDSIYDSFGFHG